MGASSSSTNGGSGAKGRRKISRASAEDGHAEDPARRANRLLMQNGHLGGTGTWHTKAHSMYELQRERSQEAQNTMAGIEETEREHQQQQQENNRKCSTTAGCAPTKISPKRRQKSGEEQDGQTASAAARAGASASEAEAGACQPTAQSSASSSTTTASNKPTQRRRPLTWAWLRGHEVSLPATAEPGAAERKAAAAANANRRRSLKVGNESTLAVNHLNNEWGGIQRQHSSSSANSAGSSSGLAQQQQQQHNLLSRRASQGKPLLAQMGRQKSMRRSDAGLPALHNPINALGREIIQFCFEQPHNEIGVRICSRLLEKRPDFRNFVYTMGKERWVQMTARLKEFLETVVRRVENIDIVERVARKYGEEHVELKCFGFKPDFWVSLADAITVECVILDQATHQPSDTITAWSLLVSIMFSAVRDGYYQAMRAARISQRHKNVHQREMALKVDSPGPAGVEKSASANELSPGKKGSGGTAFKYLNEFTLKEDCAEEADRNGTVEVKKVSPKKVDFF